MVRILEMPRAPYSDLLGAASKLNRDPVFLAHLQRSGAEQADRFLVGLALERAWLDHDAESVTDLLRRARITMAAPFAPLSGDPVRAVGELLAREVTVDPTRKQLAGAEITWRVRVSRPDQTIVKGTATAIVDQGRISTLRLGPDT